MRQVIFAVFFYVFFGSFLWAEISFHYVADLEFFYEERSASLSQTLTQEFGEQAIFTRTEGILGVQGVSSSHVKEILNRLRNEERQQVLWEFFLITALPCEEYKEAIFISVDAQKKVLETLKEKKLISRTLVPARRGTTLKWRSEKQKIQHRDQRVALNSLEQAQIFFQGAEIELISNAGKEPLQLEAKLNLKYFEGDKPQRYFFHGKTPTDANELKSSIWFVPFQQRTPCLYFMISAWPASVPELKKLPVWEPVVKTNLGRVQSYKKWPAPQQTGDKLPDLTEMYEVSHSKKEVSPTVLQKQPGFEIWEPLFLKERSDTKFQILPNWVQIEGDVSVHQSLSSAEQIYEKYSAEQVQIKMEHFLLQSKHSFSVYQQVIPLIAIPFSLEQRQNFFKTLQPLSWVREQQLENRICLNRNQSWETTKQENSFLKGILVDQGSSKIRTVTDTLSEGVATNLQVILLENTQEYYLSYEYQRNGFEKPCPERNLVYGEGLSLKIQEPILYRESYQIKTLVPKGYSHCFWGLPLNLLSEEFQETLTFFRCAN
ncbi:MAG: hypothetical protein AABZ60_17340 [Planctomycetota bacterium]